MELKYFYGMPIPLASTGSPRRIIFELGMHCFEMKLYRETFRLELKFLFTHKGNVSAFKAKVSLNLKYMLVLMHARNINLDKK